MTPLTDSAKHGGNAKKPDELIFLSPLTKATNGMTMQCRFGDLIKSFISKIRKARLPFVMFIHPGQAVYNFIQADRRPTMGTSDTNRSIREITLLHQFNLISYVGPLIITSVAGNPNTGEHTLSLDDMGIWGSSGGGVKVIQRKRSLNPD